MNKVGLIVFGDFIAFWVSLIAILFVRFGISGFKPAIYVHILPFTILYLSWALLFFLFGLYDLFTIKPTIPHFSRFGMALSASFVVGILLFYFLPIFGITPKTNLIFQILGFGLISVFIRRIFFILFSKTITRPVVLIGTSPDITEIKNVILNHPQLGLKIVAHIDSFHEALEKYSSGENTLFIFKKIPDEMSKEDILNIYKNKIEIIDVAHAYESYLQKIPVSYIDQLWIIENIYTKENILYAFLREVIDVIFSVCVLIITSPILLVTALFIYFYDKGPIVYKQERVGLNGNSFELYKLRSMKMDAELNGAVWADKKDCRVTPVGKIIRRLHIDEIPQMINILKGDLTLVGPRPERPEFVTMLEKTIPHYEIRHIIRPGFTGWAQIKYRYANTVEASREKFEYDLYYIKNKNIFIDLGIIIRTIQIVFTH